MRAYGSRPKDQGWCLCHDHWRCRHEKKALKRLLRKRARREPSFVGQRRKAPVS